MKVFNRRDSSVRGRIVLGAASHVASETNSKYGICVSHHIFRVVKMTLCPVFTSTFVLAPIDDSRLLSSGHACRWPESGSSGELIEAVDPSLRATGYRPTKRKRFHVILAESFPSSYFGVVETSVRAWR